VVSLSRRSFLRASTAVATAAVVGVGSLMPSPSQAATQLIAWDKAVPPADYPERVIGKVDAPVTIIEYSSLTCGHCATFHNEVLPMVKEKLLDTGKARLVVRDFPLDQYAFAAALIARRAPKESYEGLVATYFAQQHVWTRSEKPVDTLKQYALLSGMSVQDVEAALKDDALFQAIRQVQISAGSAYGIKATPTFVVEGKVVEGVQSYDTLKAMVEAAKK